MYALLLYFVTLQENHCPKVTKKGQTVVISHHQAHLCQKKVHIYRNWNKKTCKIMFQFFKPMFSEMVYQEMLPPPALFRTPRAVKNG